jgi:beta-galactosidase
MRIPITCLALTVLIFHAGFATNAERYEITLQPAAAPKSDGFKMGNSRRPDGSTITLDSNSLRLDGEPWVPVMGEFHYSRYPQNEWREELLKMKAGGVDIVATYVFWIHHEEVEGQFDWSGRRSLRRFIETAHDVGLKAVVRCGPWCHGEVRNGGLPDWILEKGWKTRSDDSNYLAKVEILYRQIAEQLHGLLWKDGGPVIGIQFENEYKGPAQHLLTLKRIGQEVGLDVPLYTRTGWDQPKGSLPFGEVVPLYGVYAEGFWDRALTPMPAGYWKGFHFSNSRMDDATFTEIPGHGGSEDPTDARQYPYLTCEIGGGMMNSYHRRILINPKDVETTALIKLGSGSTLLGYYMYHGGVNPDGKLTTLMESQATGYWNDMPVKNYDFQAPLGEYGQIRPQYHLLRRLHLFLHDWGTSLAKMPATMPEQRPIGKSDLDTLRWCVRSDGDAGFVFVNNYQRLQMLPEKKDVKFIINCRSGPMTIPDKPVTIPSGSSFLWPLNLDLGNHIRLKWATAQPVCAISNGNVRTVFFSETDGVSADFAFENARGLKVFTGHTVETDAGVIVRDMRSGTSPVLRISETDGSAVQLVLLDSADSLALWKQTWTGRERVFLTKAGLVCDGDELRLTSTKPDELNVCVYPAPSSVSENSAPLRGRNDGIFRRFTPKVSLQKKSVPTFENIQAAGPAREIPLGKIKQAVAAAPEDADFEKAAIWQIKLPRDLDLPANPILRLHYVGDVARVMLKGKLLTDDFYNGLPLDIGLRRHAPEILNGDLRLAILPLRKDAPIYMAEQARPQFDKNEPVGILKSAEIIEHYQAKLIAR